MRQQRGCRNKSSARRLAPLKLRLFSRSPVKFVVKMENLAVSAALSELFCIIWPRLQRASAHVYSCRSFKDFKKWWIIPIVPAPHRYLNSLEKKKTIIKKKEERLYVLSSGIMFWPIRLITDAFWRAALRQTDSGCMNIHPSSTAPDPSSGAFMF